MVILDQAEVVGLVVVGNLVDQASDLIAAGNQAGLAEVEDLVDSFDPADEEALVDLVVVEAQVVQVVVAASVEVVNLVDLVEQPVVVTQVVQTVQVVLASLVALVDVINLIGPVTDRAAVESLVIQALDQFEIEEAYRVVLAVVAF